MTTISWTEATWNPIIGCSVTSPGCTNCYAMRDAWRKEHNPRLPAYSGLVTRGPNGNKPPVWTGKVAWNSQAAVMAPLKRRKPTMWFVNSMGDLFHPAVPDEWLDRVFAIMALCPQHTFQILTKQAERMREYLVGDDLSDRLNFEIEQIAFDHSDPHARRSDDLRATAPTIDEDYWPIPNVWLGVSAEDQIRADKRIPHLLNTPAAVRFVSAEPLIGPLDLARLFHDHPAHTDALRGMYVGERGQIETAKLDWVIVGGESGPGARPMHPNWARSIRGQCAAAGVPFHFKQWGEWVPPSSETDDTIELTLANIAGASRDAREWLDRDGWPTMARVGKKAAGRLLDGQTHDGFPVRGRGA